MKDGSGYITQSLDVSTSEDVKWVHLTGTVNVSSSITSLNIQLINYGQQPGVDDWYSVWFDDVIIKETNKAIEIIPENHYYPFGMQYKGYNNIVNGGNAVAQKWTYNNREYSEALGLNIYEMNFRQYDVVLGRFNSIDKLAELATNITPYRYAFNNPVYWSDPLGLFETRKAARRYRRENDIDGKIVRNSDGTFSIEDSENKASYWMDSEGNVEASVLIVGEPTVLQTLQFMSGWGQLYIGARWDKFVRAGKEVEGKVAKYKHINGRFYSQKYRGEDGIV